MLNTSYLMGRLGDDPKTGLFGSNNKYANFSIAVKRDHKNAKGDYDTDWFDVVSFGMLADFVEKYLHKGSKVLIEGKLQNDNYVKDGVTIYKNKIVASRIEFCESKPQNDKTAEEKQPEKTTIPETEKMSGDEDIWGYNAWNDKTNIAPFLLKSGEEPEAVDPELEKYFT